jgi:hypothetical protein
MPSSSAPTFGELLREHRLAAGLTQEELAERAGLSGPAWPVRNSPRPRACRRGMVIFGGLQLVLYR